METKLQSKQQYPRFIQNKPCGIDKFDGGSQERLAKTIARHFCQNDSLDEECTLPRIIGIEGIWGSGKSNVVKMLERELSDDYYFFEYDAWGHQEDLQRRSILELLTSWKSHATLTLLAKQDLAPFGYNMIDPLKSWCWGSILFYPFKISRFS